MNKADNLIISDVLRWGNEKEVSKQKNNQDNIQLSYFSCDDHCNDCNHGNCYDCACDNDDRCRSEW